MHVASAGATMCEMASSLTLWVPPWGWLEWPEAGWHFSLHMAFLLASMASSHHSILRMTGLLTRWLASHRGEAEG